MYLITTIYTSQKVGFAQGQRIPEGLETEAAVLPARGSFWRFFSLNMECGIFISMKLLVTGASGLLGRSLMKLLASYPDMETKGVAFSRAKAPLEKLDLTEERSVALFFAHFRPDAVIHLAAERRPDIVDKDLERARAINVDATQIIARECAKRGVFLLLISTDYVFDGSAPPYFPHSPVHPLNEYGRMKLEAERVAETALSGIVRTSGGRSVGAVLRIPILYGPVEYLEESSVTEIALALKSTEPRSIEHWAHRYPAHVDDVSTAIMAVVDACMQRRAVYGPFPRFLLSGKESYTKYEMAKAMAGALGIDASHIRPDPSPPKGTPRPRDCRMDTSLLESLGWRQEKYFSSSIGDIIKPFFS
jgi:dTDP-4-dehydrorhamnose reductase